MTPRKCSIHFCFPILSLFLPWPLIGIKFLLKQEQKSSSSDYFGIWAGLGEGMIMYQLFTEKRTPQWSPQR